MTASFFLYGTYIPADHLAVVAREAEALGFDGISLPDHVVYPSQVATRYPYPPDPVSGRAPWDATCEWLDPVAATAVVTTATERMQVVTGIFVLPLRDPILVAKAFATLDALSSGRVILGVGAGWMREEFEILGADFDTRGPRTNEAIEVLRKLWTGEPVDHQGQFFTFPEMSMRPAAPGMRVFIGGGSGPALRRAAQLGDGMLPPLNSERTTAAQLETIAQIRAQHGRTGRFQYIASAVSARNPEAIGAITELGVDAVHVDPFALYVQAFGGLTLDERRRALERYAREVITPYRAATG